MTRQKWIAPLAVSLCCLAGMVRAADPTESATILVQAAIVPGCLIQNSYAPGLDSNLDGRDDVEWGTLSFGSVPAAGTSGRKTNLAQITWNESVTLFCTPGIPVSMMVDAGVNGARLLKEATSGQMLPYSLYADAAMTVPLDPGVAVSIEGTSGFDYDNIVLPIYGHVTLPQVGRTGTYTDTIRVTLEW